jgi:hypothetical protein
MYIHTCPGVRGADRNWAVESVMGRGGDGRRGVGGGDFGEGMGRRHTIWGYCNIRMEV